MGSYTARRKAKRHNLKALSQVNRQLSGLDGVEERQAPPQRIACFPIPIHILKTMLGLPEDMIVAGIQMADDGSMLGLLVEWEKMPPVKHGEPIPELQARYTCTVPAMTIGALEWRKRGEVETFVWYTPSPSSLTAEQLREARAEQPGVKT